jgi:hypothetical protein
MNIFENFENINISAECLSDILELAEEYIIEAFVDEILQCEEIQESNPGLQYAYASNPDYMPKYKREGTPKPSGGRAIGMYYKGLNNQRKKVKGSGEQANSIENLKKEYKHSPGMIYAKTQTKFKRALEQIKNYKDMLKGAKDQAQKNIIQGNIKRVINNMKRYDSKAARALPKLAKIQANKSFVTDEE